MSELMLISVFIYLLPGVRFCTEQPETQRGGITCGTIRLVPVSTRLMGRGTAVRTALTVPLLTAPMTSVARSMTSGGELTFEAIVHLNMKIVNIYSSYHYKTYICSLL